MLGQIKSFDKSHAYTLIELIITIVLSTIVMVIFFTVFGQSQVQSVSPVIQVKASELAQAYLEEISLKRFDENSPVGNSLPCNAPTAVLCSAAPGTEGGETRVNFDDVDDYDGLSETPPKDALNNSRSGFGGFSVNVSVGYAGDDFGLATQDLKKIQVTVSSPEGDQYVFSQYKGNF